MEGSSAASVCCISLLHQSAASVCCISLLHQSAPQLSTATHFAAAAAADDDAHTLCNNVDV
jgi:hypothetical protein